MPSSEHVGALRRPLITAIRRFPKGSIWQTRYLSLPLTLIATTRCVLLSDLGRPAQLAYFALGLLTWSLMEYLLHRYLLHWAPTGPVGRALLDRLHAAHHVDPKDETQVCVPLILSAPLWLALYLGLVILGGNPAASAFVICGIALASVVYDIIHYAAHYGRVPNRWMGALKRNHMFHHHSDHDRRFGVSSPLWDHVFKSY